MDIDGDGRIAYYELENLIREQLRISSFKLPDEKIQAVWLSVDTDRSGWWSSSGESRTLSSARPKQRAPQAVRTRSSAHA